MDRQEESEGEKGQETRDSEINFCDKECVQGLKRKKTKYCKRKKGAFVQKQIKQAKNIRRMVGSTYVVVQVE